MSETQSYLQLDAKFVDASVAIQKIKKTQKTEKVRIVHNLASKREHSRSREKRRK